MLSIQALLLTSSLAIIAGMLGSVAWLSALRRQGEPVRVETPNDAV